MSHAAARSAAVEHAGVRFDQVARGVSLLDGGVMGILIEERGERSLRRHGPTLFRKCFARPCRRLRRGWSGTCPWR